MPNNEDATKTFYTQEDADNNTSTIPANELNSGKEETDDNPPLDEEDLEENDLNEEEAEDIEWDDTEEETGKNEE